MTSFQITVRDNHKRHLCVQEAHWKDTREEFELKNTGLAPMARDQASLNCSGIECLSIALLTVYLLPAGAYIQHVCGLSVFFVYHHE